MPEEQEQQNPRQGSRWWNAVKTERAKLDPKREVHYVTSLGNDVGAKPGVVRAMDIEGAARALASREWKPASKEEIAAHDAEVAKARTAILEEEQTRLARAFIDPSRFTAPAAKP